MPALVSAFAEPGNAGFRITALNAAPAAVVRVGSGVNAPAPAHDEREHAVAHRHAHVQTVPHADKICWATARAAAAVSTTPIGRAVGDTVVRLTRAVLASRSGAANVFWNNALVLQ